MFVKNSKIVFLLKNGHQQHDVEEERDNKVQQAIRKK
jgi:hypothetical protein